MLYEYAPQDKINSVKEAPLKKPVKGVCQIIVDSMFFRWLCFNQKNKPVF